MSSKRIVIVGAGELGFHLARTLVHDNHLVTLIDIDPERGERSEDLLDVRFIVGSGTDLEVLQQADVANTDLVVTASNNEEVNLVGSVHVKALGAPRTAVRLETTERLSTHRRHYESAFHADLLISPQVLATTEVLNRILGHNTHEIDFLAQGQIQLRTIRIQEGCRAATTALLELDLPDNSRVIAYYDAEGVMTVPNPDTKAPAGGQALVVCTRAVIREVEKVFSERLFKPRRVTIAGANRQALAIAEALSRDVTTITILERNRAAAQQAAERFPKAEVLHVDVTDVETLRSERIETSDAFVAATVNDETNLMAGLIAEELGVGKVVALVSRTETTELWDRSGALDTISPRYLAVHRIEDYIASDYRADMISLEGGALQVLQRPIYPASPVAGASLAEIDTPSGLILGAIVRDEQVFVPSADDRLQPEDQVILFVHRESRSNVRLFFPDPRQEQNAPTLPSL